MKLKKMITFEEYKNIVLSFPDVTEQAHFDNPSFRVKNKIFATYWAKENKAMLRLTSVEQSVFCSYDRSIFHPVNGNWGKLGATLVNLNLVRKDMFVDAVKCAYNEVKKTRSSGKK